MEMDVVEKPGSYCALNVRLRRFDFQYLANAGPFLRDKKSFNPEECYFPVRRILLRLRGFAAVLLLLQYDVPRLA